MIDNLVAEYESARDAEADRLTKLLRPRISPWNPRATLERDQTFRDDLARRLKSWSIKWWADRGYRLEFDHEDGFTTYPLS